ncbi:MAG: alanine--tRNA ligase [Patescibacteria group bacterium]
MTVNEVRQKFFDFYTARGHVLIPSVPLIPENDPTTLFVGSGMQPLIPYLLGAPHPLGTRVVNAQLAFRAGDIEEIGDNRHTSTFEMLGNWSFGDYFKAEQIPWVFEFLTREAGIDASKLSISCFEGDEKFGFPKDTEAADIWRGLGIADDHIYYYDAGKNWWSRAGRPDQMPAGEPGGPSSEIFYDFGTPHNPAFGETCHPNCDCGRFMEIGNCVFMMYKKNADGTFSKLPKANVDFGGGLERICAASLNTPDIFKIDTMWATIQAIQTKTDAIYEHDLLTRSFRIVADHLRGAVFMISDGVLPSNTEQGYILRRLIRRAIQHADRISAKTVSLADLAETVIEPYKNMYPRIAEKSAFIVSTLADEEIRFRKTIQAGMKEFEKLATKNISGTDAFVLFSTYGFPVELTEELIRERGFSVDMNAYRDEMVKHQDTSRAGSEQKFKGGLADTSEKTTMLHTSTHLMLAGLRKYLGDHVHQAGSNITHERTRFDFTHPEKVPRDILDKVEAYVNEAIQKKCDVVIEERPKDEAKAAGVEGSFWEKYPDVVNVYMVKCADGTVYSQELCGGPHVVNTGAIQGTFKIVKEEASSAGVRRIKGVLV